MNCWQNLRTHGTCSVATSLLYNRFGPHQIGVAAVNEIKTTRINYCRTERKKCRKIQEHSCITLSLLGLTSEWGLYCRPWAPTHTYNKHDRHPVTKSFLFLSASVKKSVCIVLPIVISLFILTAKLQFQQQQIITSLYSGTIYLQFSSASSSVLIKQPSGEEFDQSNDLCVWISSFYWLCNR